MKLKYQLRTHSAEHLHRLVHHQGLRVRSGPGPLLRQRAVREFLVGPDLWHDDLGEPHEMCAIAAIQLLEQRQFRLGEPPLPLH